MLTTAEELTGTERTGRAVFSPLGAPVRALETRRPQCDMHGPTGTPRSAHTEGTPSPRARPPAFAKPRPVGALGSERRRRPSPPTVRRTRPASTTARAPRARARAARGSGCRGSIREPRTRSDWAGAGPHPSGLTRSARAAARSVAGRPVEPSEEREREREREPAKCGERREALTEAVQLVCCAHREAARRCTRPAESTRRARRVSGAGDERGGRHTGQMGDSTFCAGRRRSGEVLVERASKEMRSRAR